MNLEIITGTVSELKISSGYDDLFSDSERSGAGMAAIGAAAMGQAFNATALAAASTASEIEMQFFSCNADGMPIVGKFDSVDFQNGDIVDFVVSGRDRIAVCHAARSASKQILWMQPYHVRGSEAQRLYDIKKNIFGSILITLALTIMTHFSHPFRDWGSFMGTNAIFLLFAYWSCGGLVDGSPFSLIKRI